MARVRCPIMVGRDAELAELAAGLDAVAAGDGRAALVLGEAGVGKSRLVRELATLAEERELPVFTGRAVPSGAAGAYRPLAQALLRLVRQTGVPLDEAAATYLPSLHPLLPGIAPAPAEGETPSVAQRGEAVLSLLRAAAPDGAVIVLEDLHWADPDTAALTEYLIDTVCDVRLLLVVTLRDGVHSVALDTASRVRSRSEVAYLPLDRLAEADLTAMVRACRAEISDDELQRVHDRAEGLPLLVEDLLASPGLPATFGDTVRARLDELRADDARSVIEAAAVLGRHVDWTLLPAITGLGDAAIEAALDAAVAHQLLVQEGTDVRFRHALTHEAVLATIPAPRQRQVAGTALRALDAAAGPPAERRDLAIDLARRAGDPREGTLLADAGMEALRWGALATAAESLQRAASLLEDAPAREATELAAVEALALAGRVDEATSLGAALVSRVRRGGGEGASALRAHLLLAQAAVTADRWPMARHHLDEARALAGDEPPADVQATLSVLDADVTIAGGHLRRARERAQEVLAIPGAPAASRCQALEIIGRSLRSDDLGGARDAFERALVEAEAAGLPHWRMRALHELGTVELFEHAGVERLLAARAEARRLGSPGTLAVLDLQLTAACTCRWDLDGCDRFIEEAISIAERHGLDTVRAKALVMACANESMRGDLAAADRYAAAALECSDGDPSLDAFGRAGQGLGLLLQGELTASLVPYAQAMAILDALGATEPGVFLALWPLLLIAAGDGRAAAAVEQLRRLRFESFWVNRSLLLLASAALEGPRSARRAAELAATAEGGFTNAGAWADLAHLLVAPAAIAAGWGEPQRWLRTAAQGFDERGLAALARQARALLDGQRTNPWAGLGITAREAEVLRLVAEGLANKEIAARLKRSPRTVEKHVESLLRKTGAHSRSGLASFAAAPPDGSEFAPTP